MTPPLQMVCTFIIYLSPYCGCIYIVVLYCTSLFKHQRVVMLLRIFFFVLIFGWLPVNGIVPVPPIYRKAEVVLKQYKSNPSYNPIIHSLFNAFIHDKRARAFISDQAIELALQQVNELDQQQQNRQCENITTNHLSYNL